MGALAIVALGSNIQPEINLPAAAARLRSLGARTVSQVYQNPAIGGMPQPDFLNAAVGLDTLRRPGELRLALRQIETELGRVRGEDKYAPRTIDLDLLLLGAVILEGPEIWLPDPGLPELPHLAVPAAELAPDWVHPTRGESLRQIADRLLPAAVLQVRPDLTMAMQLALQQAPAEP